jgi:hypothetical protein
MTYDGGRGQCVLIAHNGSTGAGETWTWDGTTWTLHSTNTTPPAQAGGVVYDPVRQRVLHYGGYTISGSPYWRKTTHQGLSEWDGTRWSNVQQPVTPGPRAAALMAYDNVRARVVLSGGTEDWSNWNGSVTFVHSDTWEIGPAVEATTVAYGRGCVGSAGTPIVVAAGVPVLGNGLFAVDLQRARPFAATLLTLGLTPTTIAFGGGCTLYVLPPSLLLTALSGSNGIASYPLGVPPDPRLLGAVLFAQGVVLDPASSWSAGFAFSDGLQLMLGQ